MTFRIGGASGLCNDCNGETGGYSMTHCERCSLRYDVAHLTNELRLMGEINTRLVDEISSKTTREKCPGGGRGDTCFDWYCPDCFPNHIKRTPIIHRVHREEGA